MFLVIELPQNSKPDKRKVWYAIASNKKDLYLETKEVSPKETEFIIECPTTCAVKVQVIDCYNGDPMQLMSEMLEIYVVDGKILNQPSMPKLKHTLIERK